MLQKRLTRDKSPRFGIGGLKVPKWAELVGISKDCMDHILGHRFLGFTMCDLNLEKGKMATGQNQVDNASTYKFTIITAKLVKLSYVQLIRSPISPDLAHCDSNLKDTLGRNLS